MSTRPGGPSETTKSASVSGCEGREYSWWASWARARAASARALSRRLGWPFEDLDDRIQARERRSIEQIFRQFGEAWFRQVGARSFAFADGRSLGASAKVVALGGGAFAQANNAALLEEAGFPTIFLDAPVEELFRRCQEQQLDRPLRRRPGRVPPLYEARRPCYLKAALRIETGGQGRGECRRRK